MCQVPSVGIGEKIKISNLKALTQGSWCMDWYKSYWYLISMDNDIRYQYFGVTSDREPTYHVFSHDNNHSSVVLFLPTVVLINSVKTREFFLSVWCKGQGIFLKKKNERNFTSMIPFSMTSVRERKVENKLIC